MDLIVTPAYHTSNSYGTLEQAETYFTSYDRLSTSATWDDLTDTQKKFALVLAANILNTFNFRGEKCNKQQNLAFPRLSYQLLLNGWKPIASFYDIKYETILENIEFEITNNKFVSTSTDADEFYDYIDNKDIQIGQLIKVVRSGTEYLTINDMDIDGQWIQVKEDIEEETDLTTSIYATDIFGFPDKIMLSQFELAYQVVDTKLFQGTIGKEVEQPITSINISGGMSVRYASEMFKINVFDNASPIDIIYYLLGNWLAGVRGATI
jgi:predicted small secreted protein